MLTVAEETPLQDAVTVLLRHSDAVAAALYPGAYRRPIDPSALAVPGVTVLVARAMGEAVGFCALFDLGDGAAELKRMIVLPSARGQGVGAALLDAAEAAARQRGFTAIRMEVGIRNTEGQALYRRAGYRERGPFGMYRPDPISLFFEKSMV